MPELYIDLHLDYANSKRRPEQGLGATPWVIRPLWTDNRRPGKD